MRAALEGVAMNLGLILNIFRAHVPIDAVTMIGGGARSGVWRQIVADVFGCPVRSLNLLRRQRRWVRRSSGESRPGSSLTSM